MLGTPASRYVYSSSGVDTRRSRFMSRGGSSMTADSAGSLAKDTAGPCSVMRSMVRITRPGSASGKAKARFRNTGSSSGSRCASV